MSWPFSSSEISSYHTSHTLFAYFIICIEGRAKSICEWRWFDPGYSLHDCHVRSQAPSTAGMAGRRLSRLERRYRDSCRSAASPADHLTSFWR